MFTLSTLLSFIFAAGKLEDTDAQREEFGAGEPGCELSVKTKLTDIANKRKLSCIWSNLFSSNERKTQIKSALKLCLYSLLEGFVQQVCLFSDSRQIMHLFVLVINGTVKHMF